MNGSDSSVVMAAVVQRQQCGVSNDDGFGSSCVAAAMVAALESSVVA